MAAAREYLPRLLRRTFKARDAACLEAAWFLASPPFALGALSLLLAAGLAAIAGAWALAAVFAAAFGMLVLALITGLVQARARAAHVARLVYRAVVPGLEGRDPTARRRKRSAPGQVL